MAKLLLGSVVGPQGPQGTPGVNGSQGPQGIPGPNEIAATTDVVGLTSGQLLYNNGGKVGSVEIVDNLLSIDPDKPLSANQGKVLKGLIDDNDSAIGQNTHDISQLSNPNLLINGDFQIWQRGTSFTNSNYSYTADRWKAASAVDAYISISKMSDYLRMQVSVLNTSGAFTEIIQPLEKFDKLIGKHVTMSAQIIPDSDTSGEIIIVGTKDGVEQRIASNLISNRDSNNIVTASGLISDGSWTHPNCRIRLFRNYTPVGKGINVKWAKLELGEIATPFSPRSYAEELAMCQRYFTKAGDTNHVRAIGIISNAIYFFIPLNVTMRGAISAFWGTIGTDTQILRNTNPGDIQAGFTLNVVARNEQGILVAANKTAHGLTDATLKINSAVPYLDSEIY